MHELLKTLHAEWSAHLPRGALALQVHGQRICSMQNLRGPKQLLSLAASSAMPGIARCHLHTADMQRLQHPTMLGVSPAPQLAVSGKALFQEHTCLLPDMSFAVHNQNPDHTDSWQHTECKLGMISIIHVLILERDPACTTCSRNG